MIEGVPSVLDKLRELKKKIFFVTNNSTKSRKGYLSKFKSLGLNVNPEGIVLLFSIIYLSISNVVYFYIMKRYFQVALQQLHI